MESEPSSLALKPPPPPDALLPKSVFPWWATAMIVVGVLMLVLVIVKLTRKKKPVDPLTLRRQAYEAALRSINEASPSDGREAATQASLILRRYLATVSGDPALFETHEEFIARRDSLKSLAEEAREAARVQFDRLAALKYSKDIRAADSAPIFESSRALLETLNRAFA
jgi:hypothetical protein